MPPPDPRSSTTSPSCSSASAVGLPHPSDATTAAVGSAATSSSPYRFPVTGSLALGPQHAVSVSPALQHPASSMVLVPTPEPTSPPPSAAPAPHSPAGAPSLTARARAAYLARTASR